MDFSIKIVLWWFEISMNFILNKTNPILIKVANKRAQGTDLNPLETNLISQRIWDTITLKCIDPIKI